MPSAVAETCVSNPILEIYKLVTKLLKESNIINPEEAD
jgi:hypothetical protein